jgi:hypothetical protein
MWGTENAGMRKGCGLHGRRTIRNDISNAFPAAIRLIAAVGRRTPGTISTQQA